MGKIDGHAKHGWPGESSWTAPGAFFHFLHFPSTGSLRFFCTADEKSKASQAWRDEGEALLEWCILGMTKFGWSCVSTVASMVILIACIPLVLAASRRRPPGVPFFSCFAKQPIQFRPPPALQSDTSMSSPRDAEQSLTISVRA